MFEFELSECDTAATIAAVEDNERVAVQTETRRLLIALHWADLHPGDAVDPDGLPGRECPVQVGGPGTPDIADFCLASLGTALKTTAGSAARLIGDALDLRHRLPATWAAVRAGQGPVYQARRVAYATRHLSKAQAGAVDARIAPRVGRVSFGRLQSLLEAYIYEADPDGADAAAEAAAQERFVRLGQTSEHGLRFIIARVSAGDAVWIDAMVARLAEILRLEGDSDPVDVRRSKAIALYHQPAEMLRLLCLHQHDDGVGEPEESRPEPVEGPAPDDVDDACPQPVEGREAEDSGRRLQIVPPPFDPAKARPRAIVYVHLSEAALLTGRGIARVEGVGPVLVSRLGLLIGDRTQIILKPVIDLNNMPAPVDSYEIPDVIREHLRLRQPVDVFPYAAGGSRRMDLDHTLRYVPTGPGRTARADLGSGSSDRWRGITTG